MSHFRLYGSLVALAVTLLTARAEANGLATPSGATDGGPPEALAPLSSLEARITLNDATAEYSEVRRYSTGASSMTFYRSLPEGAASVAVSAGGEPLTGSILEPADADAERERLVTALGDPAPLRELGMRLFVADIAAPLGAAEVAFEMEVPLVGYGTFSGLSVGVDWHRAPVGSVAVEVDAATEAPLRALYAPNHDLTLQRIDGHRALGSFSRSNVYTELDLTVLLSTGNEPIRLDLLPFRYEPDGAGYFLAFLSPDLALSDGDVSSRDLVFAFDTSGSMAGEKIVQAKDALTTVLGELSPRDSFAIVTFSTDAVAFRPEAVPADSANIAAALGYVESLVAEGSTNIHGALTAAFDALPDGGEQARYVVLMTDGQPTAGDTSTEGILDVARQRQELGARVFSFGVGYDVNTVLLDRLADESSGDALYVRPGESVSVAVTTFFEQIADPVLISPELDVTAFGGSDPYPAEMQDLFASLTTLVAGRYTTPGQASILLRGFRDGASVETVFDVTLPEHDTRIGNVPRVWALRHLGALFEDLKLGASDPLADEALATATRFGVGTAFTSFALDVNGDTVMTYSPVPLDAVGEVAVDTSSLLDGYTKSSSYSTYVTADVRYLGDRVFPLQGGYYTDSSLGNRDDWIDVSFGSALYQELARSESYPSAAAFLSVASNVKFELQGRAFRVTSASWPEAGTLGLPPESAAIPAPLFEAGASTETTVASRDADVVALPEGEGLPGATKPADGLIEPSLGKDQPIGGDPFAAGAGCGCKVGAAKSRDRSASTAVWAVCLLAMTRLRQRARGGLAS